MPVTNRPKFSTPVMTPSSSGADFVGHVVEQFHLLELALGFGGPLLAFAAVVAIGQELVHPLLGLLAAVELVDEAVDREVRVAADRRGEVAVAIARQCVVTFFLGAVGRSLHRAERGIVDGVLARVALHRVEQFLQLEAVFEVVDFVAKLADEFGEDLHLSRIGAAVNASQENQAGVFQLFGHRLVRREHELFDDLMALGVLGEVSTGDAAVGVEVDFHLRHGELECAAFEAAHAEASLPARACGRRST